MSSSMSASDAVPWAFRAPRSANAVASTTSKAPASRHSRRRSRLCADNRSAGPPGPSTALDLQSARSALTAI
eukprot:16443930-Heterocapsa_arctica.AAC.1